MRCCRLRQRKFHEQEPAAKRKPPFWETIRTAWGPYRRLYSYVGPYKWRFVVGLAFGFAFGVVNSLFPLVVAKVTAAIFPHGAPIQCRIRWLQGHREIFNVGPQLNSIMAICLAIPVLMFLRGSVPTATPTT